jgi:N6-L-threonylcarbamoyladenine synthase
VLVDRAEHALNAAPGAKALVVAGGVAANTAIRASLSALAANRGLKMLAPPLRYCTDNAVMVAWAGLERLGCGGTAPLSYNPRPRWPLAELSSA